MQCLSTILANIASNSIAAEQTCCRRLPIYFIDRINPFSGSSFGFRPKRSAHDALRQSSQWVSKGNTWVVDLDLEKYFYTANHDRFLNRLSKNIGNKRGLRLVGQYLRAGLLQEGVVTQREQGTPQGGSLSPLLSNLVLDELDKELEKRGHCFSRYADDCNIYVSSQAAGERVLASITEFLERKLKLRVNQTKSACDKVSNRQFLGYRLREDGSLNLSPRTIERFKRRVRELTFRNRGCGLGKVISELTVYLRGWLHYFKLAQARALMQDFDAWIRRRLRCYRIKQRKRRWPIAK